MTRALLVVAHPDDEVLFAGSRLLVHPDWDWTVVCMTYKDADWRGREFDASQRAFRAEGVESLNYVMLGMADEDIPEHEFARWEDALVAWKEADEGDYDAVFTHNRVGEYGHPHHIACNVFVRRHFEPVWEFFYPPDVSGAVELWRSGQVDYAFHERKEYVFQTAYGGHWAALYSHQTALMTLLIKARCDFVTRLP